MERVFKFRKDRKVEEVPMDEIEHCEEACPKCGRGAMKLAKDYFTIEWPQVPNGPYVFTPVTTPQNGLTTTTTMPSNITWGTFRTLSSGLVQSLGGTTTSLGPYDQTSFKFDTESV